MANQDLPRPRSRTRPERVADAERARSLGLAERVFDVMMMILFALLGAILIMLAVMLSSVLSVVGGVVVMATTIPLWLGGGGRAGRHRRRLRWYPVAALMLIIGLVLWLNPWA